MASPDKTPQPGFPPYSELAAEVVRLRERVDYLETVDMRATLEQREAEVVRLRQEREQQEEAWVVERDRLETAHAETGRVVERLREALRWIADNTTEAHIHHSAAALVASPDKPPEPE